MRHGRVRPPFGLHRQIFWSLVGAMVVTSLFTFVVFRAWTPTSGSPSLGLALGVGAVALALLWITSWRLSWRLVSPLNRLVSVVQQLGAGDLSARAGFRRDARDEVARVAHAIDSMADRLEQQVRDERTLLALISHELRTPLARVRVLTAMARDGQRDAIEQIDREVADIDDLVAKVLVRSRLMFGTMTVREVSMVSAVSGALERAGLPVGLMHVSGDAAVESNALGASTSDAASPAALRPLPGPTSEGPGADVVRADPTLLHRAIANIIDNAVRHGGGIESVEIVVVAGEVLVDVLDRGSGFPDADPSTRFQPFAPEVGGTRGDGLGLGMHLIRQIIDAHDGRVWARNRPEGGADVGFALPRVRAR